MSDTKEIILTIANLERIAKNGKIQLFTIASMLAALSNRLLILQSQGSLSVTK